MAASLKPGAPLRIGLIFDDSLDKPDGVQQYVLSIGEWLRKQGHDVHYLVGETKRLDLKNLHSLSRNLNVRFNGNRMSIPMPSSRRSLRQLLASQQFDVLHVQMPYSPFLAHRLIMAAGPETAVIGTFHVFASSRLVSAATSLLGLWLHASLRRFDSIVSVSTAAADFAAKTFRIKTSVLPNVIDFERFESAKPLPRYSDEVLTILFLGRLVPRKGCQLLLEAIVQLQHDSDLPAYRVVVCGKGPLADKLLRYSNDHQLGNVVEFVGFVSEADKPSYYASADIAVFPSNGGESFGIVLIEAMASGHATVLAGNNPGYRSVMIDRPELLFNPNNTASLATKLRQYLKDSRLRQEACKWGQSYSQDYDTTVVGTKLLKIYAKALRNRRQQ